MSMLGNLSEFALPDIFQMFERSKKTGQLSILTQAGVYRIAFCQGRIVAAVSPDSKYSLRKIMLQSETLSDAAIKHLNTLSRPAEPLGKFLKQKEWIDLSLLALAFRTQIQVGIYPLFNLESGQFRFSTKAPFPYEEMTGMSKSSIEVALDALRRCQASAFVDDDLPLPDSRFMRASADLPLFKLSSLEWSVLENVLPEYQISDLSQLLKSDLLEVRQVCGRLSKVSLLVEVKGQPKPLKESSKKPGGDVTSRSEVMQRRLQDIADKQRPEKTLTSNSSPSKKTAINPTLLSRFASVLKGL